MVMDLKVLAIHLKRFTYNERLDRLTKLSHRVVFPFELRLSNTTDDAEAADTAYDLASSKQTDTHRHDTHIHRHAHAQTQTQTHTHVCVYIYIKFWKKISFPDIVVIVSRTVDGGTESRFAKPPFASSAIYADDHIRACALF